MTGQDPVQSVMNEPSDSENLAESEAKRRKVRKGTRSCWECKRRKIRCSFSAPSDAVCIACRKRASKCIGQEVPEEDAQHDPFTGRRGRYVGDRIVRVEALIEQLVKQTGNGANGSPSMDRSTSNPDGHTDLSRDLNTPASSNAPDSACFSAPETISRPESRPERSYLDSSLSPSIIRTPESFPSPHIAIISRDQRQQQISAALYAALPPREDIQLMVNTGMDISFHKLFTHPYSVLAQSPGAWKGNLSELPTEDAHPVLLGRYMLLLATSLQHVHPELHAEEIRRMSEPPRQLMRRLADTVINLVTKSDEFLDSIEGLECIMLESMFEANSGHLRRAWFACRRAMLVAQMMGLHRNGTQLLKVIDPSQPTYPSNFWYRIVCTDRQLCLMLGLPQGSLDISMVSEAALASETPSGRFERRQCIIASRILERNESSDPAVMEDFAALKELDAQLQRAANEMPTKWWLVPNLASVVHDLEKTFWETVRLLEQMLYFNLLNLVHLPYMLRSNTPSTARYDHSKLTCVIASREMLNRFIMFRSFNRVAFACRAVDFFALIAAMTLVIAHLDGHRKEREGPNATQGLGINVLAHQRNSDRAMMEQVLENMEGVAKLSGDVLSERSASLLKLLLALEIDAGQGKVYDDNFSVAAAVTELHPDSATNDGQHVQICIPYFGTIKIDRDGAVTMEGPPRDPNTYSITTATGIPSSDGGIHDSGLNSSREGEPSNTDAIPTTEPSTTEAAPSLITPTSPTGVPTQRHFTPRFPSTINDTLQQQYLYPGLTAGADDWAFQGVDMAFFDSLIRGSQAENEGNDN